MWLISGINNFFSNTTFNDYLWLLLMIIIMFYANYHLWFLNLLLITIDYYWLLLLIIDNYWLLLVIIYEYLWLLVVILLWCVSVAYIKEVKGHFSQKMFRKINIIGVKTLNK